MSTMQNILASPEFRTFSIPEQKAILDQAGEPDWQALGNDQQLKVLSQYRERESPVKSEQPEAQLMGALLGSVIPGGASAVASKVLGGVQGLKGVAARSAVDIATEAAMQLGGLSNAGGAGMVAAGGTGPAIEGATAGIKKAGAFAGRYLPDMAGILKEEGIATAQEAAKKLDPSVASKTLYAPLDAQTAGMEIQFPGAIKYAEQLKKQKRLSPSPEVEQFIRRAPGELQVPGTPGTPAQTVNTGLLDARGNPITRMTPGTPGTPAKGISRAEAQLAISDYGDDIRKARREDDNKTVKDLTLIRNKLGEDLEQGLGQSVNEGYREAAKAFRQEEASKEVLDMVESSTNAAGGVYRINFDQTLNKLRKMRREDDFFEKSFPKGELDEFSTTIQDLAVEVAKYGKSKEFAFTARMGSILAGGVGGAVAAAAVPTLVATAMKTKSGRAMILRMVRGNGPRPGSLKALTDQYRPGRAVAQGLRGGLEGVSGEEE
jgi:hypothetical protein